MKKGFTLIEVLMAVTILGLSMAILLTSVSNCLAVVRRAQEYQAAQWALSLGETEHPPTESDKPENLIVEPVKYENGLSYSREVEEDADQDDLFVVRDKATWSYRGVEKSEEVVRHIFVQGSSKNASGSSDTGLLKAPATKPAPGATSGPVPGRPPATVPGRPPGPWGAGMPGKAAQ
ncbi:MAG: type II secretion system protein [Verrucomicrobiota bacterium]|nr:type II secretion system protein [Verrucomicrobiota bacterium]